MTPRHNIQVSVDTEFLADQSDPDSLRWVFAYHITIRNEGSVSARLLTRHWVITDGEVGSMRGSYQMIGEDGTHFDAHVPMFTLAVPHALH